ncbi:MULTISPECIES: citrate synthase [unclassified Pseudactinotalea]|uniref:citrate synthase n=1 Tax=unclassified Pseudactinotalea TaxID=2649176 RepID=UPI00128E0D3B|nr:MULTISPECIES: citrate synthase [unclassified Pseudactinotalea]MPV48789.1 citrate synthase [Pseudactinotalea sp. HY160]QGH68772.1 citrate synthase [Pseudactinotalea sp. HY158]
MSETPLTPATFRVDDKELEFRRVAAVEGNDGVVISNLLKETGLVTLDLGFGNTANTESKITYIDGGAGILRYRGYPIDQLAESSTFLETAYLLINGELPTGSELEAFTERINRHTLLHENFQKFFTAFPLDAHPMSILQAGIAGLSTYYEHTLDPYDPEQLELATVLLLAKVPTMIANIAKRATGLPQLYPDVNKGYIEDFLRMTFGLPFQNADPDPVLVRALDMLLILHADHEQNCSASTVRMVGSADANIFSSVSAGIGALSGPLHGGANEAVLAMLNRIHDSDDDVDTFMTKVKNKESGVRLMGFGHRVYKNYDPRAAIVKKSADEVLAKLGVSDPLLDIARELEEIALSDDYFIERKLYPNVDFYTGLIYKAMGFPTSLFTPLFALGRMPGWIAQYREMITDPTKRIGRPRQVYTGAAEREYVAIDAR